MLPILSAISGPVYLQTSTHSSDLWPPLQNPGPDDSRGAAHKLKPGPSVHTHSGTSRLSGPEFMPPYLTLKELIEVSSNPSLTFPLVHIEFEFQHLTRPVGFVSKSLSETERNYATHDKELLSVIRGLAEWRHILEGTKHKVEILNDHQIWPTSTLLKTSIITKLAGPSTFLALIWNWYTILNVTQPSLMPSQDG